MTVFHSGRIYETFIVQLVNSLQHLLSSHKRKSCSFLRPRRYLAKTSSPHITPKLISSAEFASGPWTDTTPVPKLTASMTSQVISLKLPRPSRDGFSPCHIIKRWRLDNLVPLRWQRIGTESLNRGRPAGSYTGLGRVSRTSGPRGGSGRESRD